MKKFSRHHCTWSRSYISFGCVATMAGMRAFLGACCQEQFELTKHEPEEHAGDRSIAPIRAQKEHKRSIKEPKVAEKYA